MCAKLIRDGDTKYGAAFDRVAEGTDFTGTDSGDLYVDDVTLTPLP
jgi:hypothetical protein